MCDNGKARLPHGGREMEKRNGSCRSLFSGIRLRRVIFSLCESGYSARLRAELAMRGAHRLQGFVSLVKVGDLGVLGHIEAVGAAGVDFVTAVVHGEAD